MATMDPSDGSEDVNDFLRRIREMGEQRDREDADRARKLEEDILEGRRLREARRAERARSLSPEKQSPASTPRSIRSPPLAKKPENLSLSPLSPSLSPRNPDTAQSSVKSINGVLDTATTQSTPSPYTEPVNSSTNNSTPSQPQPSPMAVAAGPVDRLSWQRRGGTLRESRARPISMIERQNPSVPTDTAGTQSSADDATFSRAQIAQSLGSKDPSWFRQTSDRVTTASPRSRENADIFHTESAQRTKLVGLSQTSTSNQDITQRFEGQLPQTTLARNVSPQPPAKDTLEAVANTDAASLERNLTLRTIRSTSPTKGMGGFVQSAMLKRSESVSKRWSANPPTLTGQDSANLRGKDRSPLRGEFSGLPSSYSAPKLGSTPMLQRDAPDEPVSRPSSSHSNTIGPPQEERGRPLSVIERERAESRGRDNPGQPSDVATSPPPSPSKRWSPVKASWLESALNKPESPKPKTAFTSQPSWMSDLQKTKRERAERAQTSEEQVKPASPRPFAPTDGNRAMPDNVKSFEQKPIMKSPPTKPKPFSLSHEKDEHKAGSIISGATAPLETPTKASDKQVPTASPKSAPNIPKKSPSIRDSKQKPVTPPKKDFRSTLKSRHASSPSKEEGEPEFKNVFGKLKRTQTEKYVAPDELKGNILRGKAALSTTDGPQKSVRRDEFKESLLEQRESIKVRAADRSPERKENVREVVDSAPPEAITRMKTLRRDAKPGPGTSGAQSIHESTDALRNVTNSIPSGEVTALKHDKPPSSTNLNSVTSNVSSKLAGRFNPNLSNILARGPPSGTSSAPLSRVSSALSQGRESLNEPATQTSSGAPLQHMTKARARGPKRKAPTTAAIKDQPQKPPTSSNSINKTLTAKSASWPKVESSQPSTPAKPASFASPARMTSKSETPASSPVASRSPPLPSKPQALRSIERPAMTNTSRIESKTSRSEPITSEPTPLSVKARSSVWGKPSGSPVSTPSRANFERPPSARTSSPILSSDKPSSKPASRSSSPVKFSRTESSTQTARQLISSFFTTKPTMQSTLPADLDALISSSKDVPTAIRTDKKQMFEFKADGKSTPVPAGQEHLIYDDEMYLCTHEFSDSSGVKTTEVYLWAGCGVPYSTLEDAHLFARKTAKDQNGRLIVLRQGKETEKFFQAVGGILVTRKGTRTNNAKSYMLCGRQHLGHMAFDQTDLSTSNLCSGFPFIIISSGKTFLWKGVGSSADEVGCARLICMDLESAADVIEVSEGEETPDFLAAFPTGQSTRPSPAADYWSSKPAQSTFRSRLFQVEQKGDAKPTIGDIAPFTQGDLYSSKIYILDAFFEIFLLVGTRTQSQSSAFATASLFAHEYSRRISAIDKRPVVSMSTVVFDGYPDKLRTFFRTWDDRAAGSKKGVKMVSLAEVMSVLKGEPDHA